MSDSDSEGNLVVDDGNEVDDSICPICHGTTYVGETISCETCTYWFHFECVGVTHNDPCVKREDVPFFCSKCRKKKSTPKSAKSKKSNKQKSVVKIVESPVAATSAASPVTTPIKLKISIGKKKPAVTPRAIELSPPRYASKSSSSRRRQAPVIAHNEVVVNNEDSDSIDSTSKKRKRKNSEDEEEKWLDAVESGNLQAVDEELKSIKDPKLMTARQRAMVDRKNNDDYNDVDAGHLSLSYTTAKKKAQQVDEEENQRIKALKSMKRKEIEQEKREQDRIKTMERLLNKKESNLKLKMGPMSTSSTSSLPTSKIIRYVNTKEGFSLTFPQDMALPIPTLKPVSPPNGTKCAIQSCKNIKKYNCSKTGRPLCSLECYKANLLIK